MEFEMSREILKRYFSNITYIDDQFDHCFMRNPSAALSKEAASDFVSEYDDEDGPPLTENGYSENAPGDPSPGEDSNDEGSGNEEPPNGCLQTLLETLSKKEFSDISLTPVLYTRETDEDALCCQIKNAPLTLIDWNLGAQKTAFAVIKKLFSATQQLKVIVVYSASYLEAKKEIDGDIESGSYKAVAAEDNLLCCISAQGSLLVIADKRRYDILTILDRIVSLFISTYGIMPIAVLDYMHKANTLSNELFGAFAVPVESLYHLQAYFSEPNELDISPKVTSFIQNKFREVCQVSPKLSKDLFAYHQQGLSDFINLSDAVASDKLKRAIDRIKDAFSGKHAEYCTILTSVDYSIFKDCCTKAIGSHSGWETFYNSFDPYFKAFREQLATQHTTSMFSGVTGASIPDDSDISVAISKLKEDYYKKEFDLLADEVRNYRTQLIPLLIQLLITSDEMLQRGSELLHNIKFTKYPSSSLSDLSAGTGLSKSKLKAFLMNKLHFGDVLIRTQNGGDTEYLLCITPPCDTFRPEKIEFNLIYIRGHEIPLDKLEVTLKKESVHTSALPMEENGLKSVRYIDWKHYEIVRFNLTKKEDFEDLCTYSRPYRMAEPYARQISNKFLSYFSRAGVDEVFFKSEANLRRLFQ